MQEVLVEIAGWAGALLILLAYIAVSTGRLTGRSPAFQWMNLLGSAGFAVNGLWHGAIPSASLNMLWLCFAAGALMSIAVRRKPA